MRDHRPLGERAGDLFTRNESSCDFDSNSLIFREQEGNPVSTLALGRCTAPFGEFLWWPLGGSGVCHENHHPCSTE